MAKKDVILKICKVISVYDDTDGERIKVYLLPEDDGKDIKDIPYAHPLLPKMLHIKPQLGESVLVLLTEANNGNSIRHYIGPIISQPQYMDKDEFYHSLSLYRNSSEKPDVAINTNPDSKGAFGVNEDIALYGRKKNDIILTENDVKIRCGSRIKDGEKNVIFNRTDPAYILLRHNDDKTEYDNPNDNISTQSYRSTATIVADKINLISSKTSPFKTNDKDNLINETEMMKILKEAHQLPYGDILVRFLSKFVNAFATHYHAYPGEKPCEKPIKEVVDFNLNTILSDNVRIN